MNTKQKLLTLALAAGFAGGASAQTVVYSEDFTGQDGKGKIGTAAVDTSGVDWTIDVSNGAYTAGSDYMAVGEDTSGVFSVRDNDAQQGGGGPEEPPLFELDVWESPAFDVTGLTDIEFSFDAYADGVFEDFSDQFNVVFDIDGSDELLFNSSVDESVTDDPMFFGSTNLNGTTLKSFSASVAATGTTAQIFIGLGNNAGSEVYAFDNISVTAVPEPEFYDALVGLLAIGFAVIRRRRS